MILKDEAIPENMQDDNMLEECKKSVQDLLSYTDKIEEGECLLSDILNKSQLPDRQNLLKIISHIYRYTKKSMHRLEYLIDEWSFFDKEIMDYGIIEEKSIVIKADTNIPSIHIILPELLPSIYKNNGEFVEYYKQANQTKQEYCISILNELSRQGISKTLFETTDQFIIEYIHFFNNKKRVKDSDNISTKSMTDLITSIFLEDDSLKRLSILVTGVYEETCTPHTELKLFAISGGN